jgi:phenylacetate-CoA ligase
MILEAIERRVCIRRWRKFIARDGASFEELDLFGAHYPDRQREILARKLLDQVRYFGGREDALPEWREAARIEDPLDLWRLWPSLPIVTKKTILDRFDPPSIRDRFAVDGVIDSTGGSTGEPTRFIRDRLMLRTAIAATYYSRTRMGWRPGIPLVSLWGSERDIGKETSLRTSFFNRLLLTFIVPGYSLDDGKVEEVLGLIRKYGKIAIYGFTSILEFLADRMLARSLSAPPGSVAAAWNGGEMLFPEQVEKFRSVFGTPILNSYGGRELSVMAFQEPGASHLRVLRPWLFLEIVDDDGKPSAPGEPGRLIWTSTICRGTPFLRYEIGDLGSCSPDAADESGISGIREIQGRIASTVKLKNGKVIQNIFWNHLFKEYREVRQFQVILQRTGGIRILLKGEGLDRTRLDAISRTVAGFTGLEDIAIEIVEAIPLTSQGKRIQVVREP